MGVSDITVTPSALGTAAVAVRDIGERVREASAVLGARGGLIVGEPGCDQALANAERLLVQTLLASATGVLSLSRALNEAGDAYSLTEAAAVPALRS
jgi:hypothetical protein